MRKAIVGAAIAPLVFGAAIAQAAVLESPAQDATVSGIGFISGWKCNATQITVRLDEGDPIPVAMHQPRGDLRSVCGETIAHGFIQQINWGYVGDGEHEMVAYDDGVEFARATFTVGSTGEEFLKDARRQSLIENFPSRGEDTLLEWNESTQHFEVLTVFESPGRSVYDRDWWRQYNHDVRGGTYATEEFLYTAVPDVAACEPGELSVGARNRALETANQIRALHGLSAVTYSTTYTEQVQATALLGAANTDPLTTATPAFACYTEAGATGAQESLLWDIGGHVAIRASIWWGGWPGTAGPGGGPSTPLPEISPTAKWTATGSLRSWGTTMSRTRCRRLPSISWPTPSSSTPSICSRSTPRGVSVSWKTTAIR